MSQHTTTVGVKNPSATASLTVSLQGRLPAENKRHFDFIDDVRVGLINPNHIGSIGGGQFTWNRRFVLIADRKTAVLVTSRFSNFVVEQLKMVEYEDAGPCWEVARELPPAKEGAKYELDPKTRLAIRINEKDESLDDAYINLRQIGDASIQIVQQEERAVFRRTRASSWTPPAVAGDVAPGSSKDFLVSDSARLLIETDSEHEIALEFINKNLQHSLRLSNVSEDGAERVMTSISQPKPAAISEQWAPGLNYVTGRVVIRKGVGALVSQNPL